MSKIGLTDGPEYGGPEMLIPSAASFVVTYWCTDAREIGAKAVVVYHVQGAHIMGNSIEKNKCSNATTVSKTKPGC